MCWRLSLPEEQEEGQHANLGVLRKPRAGISQSNRLWTPLYSPNDLGPWRMEVGL